MSIKTRETDVVKGTIKGTAKFQLSDEKFSIKTSASCKKNKSHITTELNLL